MQPKQLYENTTYRYCIFKIIEKDTLPQNLESYYSSLVINFVTPNFGAIYLF